MARDPKNRDVKPDLWSEPVTDSRLTLRDSFSQKVVNRAQMKTLLTDFLFMVIFGFCSVVKGLFRSDSPLIKRQDSPE